MRILFLTSLLKFWCEISIPLPSGTARNHAAACDVAPLCTILQKRESGSSLIACSVVLMWFSLSCLVSRRCRCLCFDNVVWRIFWRVICLSMWAKMVTLSM